MIQKKNGCNIIDFLIVIIPISLIIIISYNGLKELKKTFKLHNSIIYTKSIMPINKIYTIKKIYITIYKD